MAKCGSAPEGFLNDLRAAVDAGVVPFVQHAMAARAFYRRRLGDPAVEFAVLEVNHGHAAHQFVVGVAVLFLQNLPQRLGDHEEAFDVVLQGTNFPGLEFLRRRR
jgi:hypothetical protein